MMICPCTEFCPYEKGTALSWECERERICEDYRRLETNGLLEITEKAINILGKNPRTIEREVRKEKVDININ